MIEVKNVRLDTAILERYARNLGSSTSRALAAVAHQVEGYAKTMSPIDTGALRNSIHVEQKSPTMFWVIDGVEYGIYQELGTHKMAAQPFMIPGTERAAKDVAKAVESELGK